MMNPDHDRHHQPDPETPTRLYNPYQDLQVRQVPIESFYKLPISPEFLFIEEAQRQRRSWGENLTFYTGCSYLTGAATGASLGLISGVRSFEPGDSSKLRVTRILNASGQSAASWANRLGILGLLYAGIESGVQATRDTDDVWNSVAAGLGTGALYRAARGIRSAAVAGAVGGALVGAAVGAKQVLKRYVPI